MNTQTTTTTDKISKGYQKLLDTVTKLESKDILTSHETARLINAKLKIEDKSISKVYKMIFEYASNDVQTLVDKMFPKSRPTFKTFKDKVKDKPYYSVYDGLLACSKLSKGAQLADKVKKQGGAIGKAAEKQTTKAEPTTSKATKVTAKVAALSA